MKKFLLPLLLCAAFTLSSTRIIAQTLTVTNSEVDEKEHYIVIGSTDKGFYAMSLALSKVDQERYRDFNYYSIKFFDNTGKLVQTYDNYDLVSPLTSKDVVALEAFVLGNELTFLCYEGKAADKFKLVQPFVKTVTPLKGFTARGGKLNDFNSVDVAVAPGGKQVLIYEDAGRFNDMGIVSAVMYNDKLEKAAYNVSLKVPMHSNSELESTYKFYSNYFVAQHDVYNSKLGSYMIHMDILNTTDGTVKQLDMMFNDYTSTEVNTVYDAAGSKLNVYCLYRTKHEGEESLFSGRITKTVDLTSGLVVKDEKHDYTADEKKITAAIEYENNAVTESFSYMLSSGDVLTIYREGKEGTGSTAYNNEWYSMYIISHDRDGKLKWVKNTNYTVKASDRFDETFIALARPEGLVLILDDDDAIKYHMIAADGTIATKALADFGTIDKDARVMTDEKYFVSDSEILVPCLYKESLEILRIKY
jgi:hypothetical protein